MNLNLINLENWPPILQLNFVLSIFFSAISISLLGFLLYLRIHKIKRTRRRTVLEEKFMDFINHYLFDEDFNIPQETDRLKRNFLKAKFDKKIAVDQILLFNENLKGESSQAIREIFLSLDLYDFILQDLRSRGWHKKARAIYIFSELAVEIPDSLIEPLINAMKDEVRQQALLYFVNVKEDNPLDFLYKIERPLTQWQQIYLENGLKNLHMDQIPDFSIWLEHPLSSVKDFCIKMIAEFNQFENIPALHQFLYHPEESLRKSVIKSLTKLGESDILPLLISEFPKETSVIRKEILKSIKELGTFDQFRSLSTFVDNQETNLKIDYYRMGRYFKPDLKERILKKELKLLGENYSIPEVA